MSVSKQFVIVFCINHAKLSWLDISKDAIVFPTVADTVFIEELKVFLDLVIVNWALSIKFQPFTVEVKVMIHMKWFNYLKDIMLIIVDEG